MGFAVVPNKILILLILGTNNARANALIQSKKVINAFLKEAKTIFHLKNIFININSKLKLY